MSDVYSPEVRIVGLTGIPEVHSGDDLVRFVLAAAERQGIAFAPGDVLVVTQKVVSKAEGRIVELAGVEPSQRAVEMAARWHKDPRLIELVLRETRAILREDHGVIITETHHGFICANAGVDMSNVEKPGQACLLPVDPDGSAEGIRRRLLDATGAGMGVVITDTFGRPWRDGLVNFAVGVAGMEALTDYDGQRDPAGQQLKVTKMAVADELASAAELVMGKLDRVPVALVRGFRTTPGHGSFRTLLRDPGLDLFR